MARLQQEADSGRGTPRRPGLRQRRRTRRRPRLNRREHNLGDSPGVEALDVAQVAADGIPGEAVIDPEIEGVVTLSGAQRSRRISIPSRWAWTREPSASLGMTWDNMASSFFTPSEAFRVSWARRCGAYHVGSSGAGSSASWRLARVRVAGRPRAWATSRASG